MSSSKSSTDSPSACNSKVDDVLSGKYHSFHNGCYPRSLLHCLDFGEVNLHSRSFLRRREYIILLLLAYLLLDLIHEQLYYYLVALALMSFPDLFFLEGPPGWM